MRKQSLEGKLTKVWKYNLARSSSILVTVKFIMNIDAAKEVIEKVSCDCHLIQRILMILTRGLI